MTPLETLLAQARERIGALNAALEISPPEHKNHFETKREEAWSFIKFIEAAIDAEKGEGNETAQESR